MKSYTTKSPEETESIGFKLAQTLRGGEVIALVAEGAGLGRERRVGRRRLVGQRRDTGGQRRRTRQTGDLESVHFLALPLRVIR